MIISFLSVYCAVQGQSFQAGLEEVSRLLVQGTNKEKERSPVLLSSNTVVAAAIFRALH